MIGGSGGGFGGDAFIVNDQELLGRYSAQITQDVLPAGTKTVPNIRANEENYRLTTILPIRQEVSVYTIQPHMHLRGKSMKCTAVYPDGREEVLLNVPHYDFNWQIIYALAQPVSAACGIHGVASKRCGTTRPRTSTTRGRTRRSSGASRAGTRCSARSSAPR